MRVSGENMKEDGDEQKKGATRAPSCPEPRVRDEKKEAGDSGPEIAETASAETAPSELAGTVRAGREEERSW